MMIYLASDVALRCVDASGFHTSALAADEERVRSRFKKVHLIYAGSYEGCRCGFQLGGYPAESLDPDELLQRRKSLHEFAAYLREELPRVGAIELYACWDGDQEEPPLCRRVLGPSSLEADDFFFLQRELSVVTNEAGSNVVV